MSEIGLLCECSSKVVLKIIFFRKKIHYDRGFMLICVDYAGMKPKNKKKWQQQPSRAKFTWKIDITHLFSKMTVAAILDVYMTTNDCTFSAKWFKSFGQNGIFD